MYYFDKRKTSLALNLVLRLKYNSLFDYENLDWKQIYLIPYKVTLDVKTTMFQFKILNRIIYTNKLLNKMRLQIPRYIRFVESTKNLSSICIYTANLPKISGSIL